MALQVIKTLLFLLVIVGNVPNTFAHELKVTVDGKERTIWTAPHQPYLTVASLAELREHYREVKDVLPPMPFIMEGKWVVPGSKDSFRTFPDDPLLEEYFSPNGNYVAQIEQWKGFVHGQRYSKRMRFMTVDGALLWEKQDGPISALVTDEGYVIGRSQYNEPLSLTYYDREGRVIKFVQGIFTERNMSKTGHLKLVPQEKLILAWEVRQVVALSYGGEILWRYAPPLEPTMTFVFPPDLDPLGRGIYVPTWAKDKSSVLLFQPQTGESQGAIWENKAIRFSLPYFSRDGKIVGIATQSQVDLLDWQTGEFLKQDKYPNGIAKSLGGKESIDIHAKTPSVIEQSSFIVVPLSQGPGTSIFNTQGDRLWYCDIRAGYTNNYLSADAKELGVAMTNGGMNEPLKFYGVLLYRIEVA